jgi:TetR/AcrR family transcriptional regulator
MPRPRRGTRPDRPAAILRAATDEFAACGYDATGMDRVARRSKVNKALIYYYYQNKRGLYHAVLQRALETLIAPLRTVAEGPASAAEKLDGWIDTLVRQLGSHPHLPSLMLRELADAGRHLDDDILRQLVGLAPLISGIVRQGQAEGRFGAFDPLMLHFVLLGTTMLLVSNAPLRRRVRKLGLAQPPLDLAPVVGHLQTIARRALRKEDPDAADSATR